MKRRDRLRPVRSGRYLLWTWDARGWRMPAPFAHWLVACWNWTACRIWGHDDTLWHLTYEDDGRRRVITPEPNGTPFSLPIEDARCANCLKPLAGCTGVGTHHERRHA